MPHSQDEDDDVFILDYLTGFHPNAADIAPVDRVWVGDERKTPGERYIGWHMAA